MDIKVSADILKDGDAWHREWTDKRNAAVAALVDDGIAQRLWTLKGDLTRDDVNDEQMRWLFWRQSKPDAERSRSDKWDSPEAYLYEGVTACMGRARDDERKRIAHALSIGLRALLGDEFHNLMYDIALENDINIGYD